MVQFFQGSYIFQFGFPIEGIHYLMELFNLSLTFSTPDACEFYTDPKSGKGAA